MKDSFGRAISYLRLSVTDRCNCRCRYCMASDGVPLRSHAELLTFEELVEVVGAATQLGCSKVRISGGEPLVRHGIVDLCRMVAHVPGIHELTMTTNATLLAPVAADLRAAGVNRLNVSLDTMRPDRYRAITRCSALADALAGIRAACAAGFPPPKINCVLMGGVNDDEIAEFVSLTMYEPVEVRFIELMPMGECASWPRTRFISGECVLEQVPGLRSVGTDGVAELYAMPGFVGRVGLIRAVSQRFCEGCDRIRLTADGRLKPCLHSAAEVSVGGLHDTALVDALRGAILAKPAHHNLAPGLAASATWRTMNQIGG